MQGILSNTDDILAPHVALAPYIQECTRRVPELHIGCQSYIQGARMCSSCTLHIFWHLISKGLHSGTLHRGLHILYIPAPYFYIGAPDIEGSTFWHPICSSATCTFLYIALTPYMYILAPYIEGSRIPAPYMELWHPTCIFWHPV